MGIVYQRRAWLGNEKRHGEEEVNRMEMTGEWNGLAV